MPGFSRAKISFTDLLANGVVFLATPKGPFAYESGLFVPAIASAVIGRA